MQVSAAKHFRFTKILGIGLCGLLMSISAQAMNQQGKSNKIDKSEQHSQKGENAPVCNKQVEQKFEVQSSSSQVQVGQNVKSSEKGLMEQSIQMDQVAQEDVGQFEQQGQIGQEQQSVEQQNDQFVQENVGKMQQGGCTLGQQQSSEQTNQFVQQEMGQFEQQAQVTQEQQVDSFVKGGQFQQSEKGCTSESQNQHSSQQLLQQGFFQNTGLIAEVIEPIHHEVVMGPSNSNATHSHLINYWANAPRIQSTQLLKPSRLKARSKVATNEQYLRVTGQGNLRTNHAKNYYVSGRHSLMSHYNGMSKEDAQTIQAIIAGYHMKKIPSKYIVPVVLVTTKCKEKEKIDHHGNAKTKSYDNNSTFGSSGVKETKAKIKTKTSEENLMAFDVTAWLNDNQFNQK